MEDLAEMVKKFKGEPISNEIIRKLSVVNRKFGMIYGKMKYSDFSDIVSEMLFINEVKLKNIYVGKNYKTIDIAGEMIRDNQENTLRTEMHNLKQCIDFMTDRYVLTGLPLPTDVLSANEYLNTGSKDFLMLQNIGRNAETVSSISEILMLLFDENTADDLLINSLLFYYTAKHMEKVNDINPYIIDIISSLYFNSFGEKIKYMFLLSKLVLIDDIVNYGINEYIICSLNYISLYLDEINGWFDKVKKSFEEKEETICALFPQYRIKKMTDLIKRNIVFRISMISQAFKISDKTAISYLKILENSKIVASTMYGRDKVYFNSDIIDIIDNGV